MGFTLQTAISELRRAVPEFAIDAEWERDNLPYLAFGDFARFICSKAEVLLYTTSDEEAHSLSKVPLCMSFLEQALEQSDSAGRDLVLDCIEALSACQWEEQIRQWAGPQVSAALGYTR
jgi:hypothetical protein